MACTQELSRRELIFQGFSALAGGLEEYLPPADGMAVSRELLGALMRGMLHDLRTCRNDLRDEDARSNLMWRCALWGSRFFQLGRRFSFPALPVREAAILSASDWGEYAGALSVLLLARFRQAVEQQPAALAQLARCLWALPVQGRTEAQLSHDSVRALEALTKELGLPTETKQLGGTVQKRLERVSSDPNLLVYTA